MPAQLETLQSRERSSPTERLARQWVLQFAELYSVGLADRGPRFVELWVSALLDLAPDTLEAACRRAMQTCKFFPTAAEIRAHIEGANAKGFELEAEEEWRKALNVATQFFQPDIGLYRNAPELSQATWHALKVAGGLEHLQSCKREELQWARRRFLADYMLIHETCQVEHLLSNGEAKRILAEVTGPAKPKPKQLTPLEPEGNLPPRAEVRTVLDRIAEIPSEEEWERRKRREKEKIAAWVAAHPEVTHAETREEITPGDAVHKTTANCGVAVAATGES